MAYSHDLYYQFSHISLKGWESVLFELGSERVKFCRNTHEGLRRSFSFTINVFDPRLILEKEAVLF